MIIKLNMSSDTAIYVQIRNQIVKGIAKGELKLGEGLPSVRQMAEDIGVNMMTVTKSYNILKREGFIEIDRRHGAKVSPIIDSSIDYKEKVQEELELLIAETGIKGLSKEDFMAMCQKVYESMNGINLSLKNA